METNHYVYINYWSQRLWEWTFIQYRYSKNERKKVENDCLKLMCDCLCKKTIISGLQVGKCCKYVENDLFIIEMEAL